MHLKQPSDQSELAIILTALVLAFGFIGAGVIVHDISGASAILFAASVFFGLAGAIGAIIMMKNTRPD